MESNTDIVATSPFQVGHDASGYISSSIPPLHTNLPHVHSIQILFFLIINRSEQFVHIYSLEDCLGNPFNFAVPPSNYYPGPLPLCQQHP